MDRSESNNPLQRGRSSLALYQQRSRRQDLMTAIDIYRNALVRPEEQECRVEIESALSVALLTLFEDEEKDEVIEECVALAKGVVLETNDDGHNQVRYRRILGKALVSWTMKKPKQAALFLDCGVEYLRESVERTEGERTDEKIMCLMEYAQALTVRYAVKGSKEDLLSAVPLLDKALEMTPEGHALRSQALHDYAVLRWDLHGHMTDGMYVDQIRLALCACEEAISLLPKGHHQRPLVLNRYGCLLWSNYTRFGNPMDLSSALHNISQAAGELSQHRIAWLQISGNFYELLSVRYLHESHLPDLTEAIQGLRDIIRKMPADYMFRFHYTSILARALVHAFSEFGRASLLDEAIDFHTEAITKALPDEVFYCYKNLSQALHLRYCANGSRADLNRAVTAIELADAWCLREGVRPRISSFLGDLLISRFSLTKETDDIDRAISSLQACVEQSHDRDSSHSGEYRSLLGYAYYQRFVAFGDHVDLLRSLKEQKEAASLLPAGHILRPIVYSRLGETLMKSFDTTRRLDEMQAAVEAYSCAVHSTRKGRSVRATYQAQLGAAMYALSGKPTDEAAMAALDILREAAQDSASFVEGRFEAATRWATIAHKDGQMQVALEGYQSAVDLLPQVAWLGLERDERLNRLSFQSSDLCQNAAACAIELGDYPKAVEMLDRGRSIIWNTSQNLRTNLSRLQSAHPLTAKELQEVSAALDTRSLQSERAFQLDPEQDAKSHRRLAERWKDLIVEVRGYDGFQNFLRPHEFSELRHAAQGGVAVMVNVSIYRCDTLLITPDKVRLVPLPSVCLDDLSLLASDLDAVLVAVKDTGGRQADEVLLRVLRRLWLILGAAISAEINQLVEPSALPRVWWCHTGVLSRLPLHACGPYDDDNGPGMADLILSSYTPTLSALLRAKHSCNTRDPTFDLLGVGSGDVQGLPNWHLPSVALEMDVLRSLKSYGDRMLLEGSQTTVSRVMEMMQKYRWLHIAAHAFQCRERPLESYILLHDGPLLLSRVAQARFSKADFAFLSACHSARAADNLPDEALHLSGGLLLAGFSGVAATLWSIADQDGPTVAKTFYSHLTKDNRAPEAADAAEALHTAVLHLRRTGVGLWRWVPFVHLGV